MLGDLILNVICFGVGRSVLWILEVFGLPKRKFGDWDCVAIGFIVIIMVLIVLILFLGVL
jgi:hypothetical protein